MMIVRVILYLFGAGLSIFLLWSKRIDKKCALIIIAGSLIALCAEASEAAGEKELTLSEIARDEKTGREKVIELEAEAGEEERETFQITVSPQDYSESELPELSRLLWAQLEKEIQGNNASMNQITEDMYFPETVDGYPFLIKWETSDAGMLTGSGRLSGEIPAEGAFVEIHAHISKEGSAFEAEHSFYAKVFPSPSQDAFWERLKKKLSELETDTRESGSYLLPESFEGKALTFRQKRDNKSFMIFLISIVGGAAVLIGKKEDREKEEKKREAEMEREYPQMVSRMTMLIGAGLSISGAFQRMAGEYGRKKPEKSEPLYEELLVACREMKSGIPERTAYQNMGTRCRLPCVIRFTALLSQYTKSGAAGIRKALWEETEQALKERKERARRLGEEAGTKLLLPMICMLILVMVIIMIPAFTSFGI